MSDWRAKPFSIPKMGKCYPIIRSLDFGGISPLYSQPSRLMARAINKVSHGSHQSPQSYFGCIQWRAWLSADHRFALWRHAGEGEARPSTAGWAREWPLVGRAEGARRGKPIPQRPRQDASPKPGAYDQSRNVVLFHGDHAHESTFDQGFRFLTRGREQHGPTPKKDVLPHPIG
jgi:hypothetical protein